MVLINCEVNLILAWYENYVISDSATDDAHNDADSPRVALRFPGNATFKITDTKLYVPVVALSTQDDNKLLEQLKTRFFKKNYKME